MLEETAKVIPMDAIGTSLSGFNASAKRLENAAVNIANQESRARIDNGEKVQSFMPKDIVQVSNEAGGVRTESRTRENATIKLYRPEDDAADDAGFVEAPNVDVAEELVNAKVASYDAKANLTALRAQNETMESVLDIIA